MKQTHRTTQLKHRTNVSTHFTIARACFQINVTFEHFHNRLNIGIVFDVELAGASNTQSTSALWGPTTAWQAICPFLVDAVDVDVHTSAQSHFDNVNATRFARHREHERRIELAGQNSIDVD
jgi:hypothetical protein